MTLRELTRWVPGVPLIISIIGLAWLVLAPVLEMSCEVPSKPPDFAPAVAELMSGRLRPDEYGIVVLPPRYASLTKTGRAFVERKKNGQVLIFFPTWGLGREGYRGYLYHNRPLSKADIPWSHQGTWAVGVAIVPKIDHQKWQLQLEVDRKVSRHWYYVRTPDAPPGG
jgi:hypothetical protein